MRWLFLHDRLRLQDIESARLSARRHLLLFRNQLVLDIGLAEGRRAVVAGDAVILEYFYHQITRALTLRSRNPGSLAAPR